MPIDFPYPYVEFEIGREGALLLPSQLDDLKKLIRKENITDLFVVSHGWRNNMDYARQLYKTLFDHVHTQEPGVPGVSGRRLAVAGIFWPAMKFGDKTLIPGGGAASFGDDEAADQVLLEQIDGLEDLLGDDADHDAFARARATLPLLADDIDAQVEFARIFLRHLPTLNEEEDPYIPPGDEVADLGSVTLLDQLGRPAPLQAPTGNGGVAAFEEGSSIPDPAGGAAGIGDFFRGIKAGAMNLLNYVTYYQMKDRAGVVGRRGVNPIVRTLRKEFSGLRIHLVGHSFGARVVTSAVAGDASNPPTDVSSMSLLQAAFSHFAFASEYDRNEHNGFFRGVVSGEHVKGPLLITHTRKDTAVGIAYAIASRVKGQIAAAIGDADDPYGGLGSNGAQKTPEASFSDMHEAGDAYPTFANGRVYNLKSDSFIAGHSEIANDEVAYAILSAVAAT